MAFLWLLAIAGLLWWKLANYEESILALAATEARASYNKDMLYRRWGANHGGVYAPLTKTNPVNPYLINIEERDITTPSKRELTLINPAYMTRQVYELADRQNGIRGHLTSLDPIRPENSPDDWERQALISFSEGTTEVKTVAQIDGKEYLRLMHPMRTEESCLKCHGYQGYKVGDLRGGISVSVPLDTYRAITKNNYLIDIVVHGAIFLLGLCGFNLAFISLSKVERRRVVAQQALEESNEAARALLNATTESAFLIDPDGTFVIMNEVSAKRLGGSVAELIGKCSYDYLPKELADSRREKLDQVIASGQPIRFSDQRAGMYLDQSVYPILDSSGRVTQLAVFAQDVTNKRLSERVLIENEVKFRSMFEEAPLNYQSLDKLGNIIEVNSNWLQTMGYTRNEIVGKNFEDLLHGRFKPMFRKSYQDFRARGEVRDIEMEMIKKDGKTILISIHGKLSQDQSKESSPTHCVLTDITHKKSAENALKNDLELNRAIAEISKELLAETYELKSVSKIASHAARLITNSEHGFVSCIDPKTYDNVTHTLTEIFSKSDQIQDQEIVFPLDEDGKYSGLWGHALNTREPFFTNSPETHFSSNSVVIGHIPLNNFMAVPVLIGEKLLGLIALANPGRDYTEKDIVAVQRIAEVFALAIHREEYENQRAEMEQNLRQLQKNEAIGALASGIAHDFNNILTPIMGYSEFLLDDIDKSSPMVGNIHQILAAAGRAKDLVKQILTFSRQHEQEIMPLRPHLLIKEVLKLIRATVPTSIAIKQDIDSECRTILADPTQIHQIAMNLLTNAYQSIIEASGILTVRLKNIDVTEKNNEVELKIGPYILFSVEDNGIGMDKTILDKIFDPYFTTRPQEKGTGLGLSVVHGIVKKYQGELRVTSSLGKGSLFEIYLPAVEPPTTAKETSDPKQNLSGDERILLVDDELPIVTLGQQLLERLGYTVDIFTDSQEALSAISSSPFHYDLVITDMTMPKITGDILTREIRKVNSGLPIIICTGFSEIMTPERAKAIEANGLLMKPVAGSEMAHMVRSVLDDAKASSHS